MKNPIIAWLKICLTFDYIIGNMRNFKHEILLAIHFLKITQKKTTLFFTKLEYGFSTNPSDLLLIKKCDPPTHLGLFGDGLK